MWFMREEKGVMKRLWRGCIVLPEGTSVTLWVMGTEARLCIRDKGG